MVCLSSRQRLIAKEILSNLENAISILKQRNKDIHTVHDYADSPGGMEKLDAACMVIIAIGESIKNLDKVTEGKLLAQYTSIEWKDIMGARDVMAHHYFQIDADIIFDIVKNDLDPLLNAIVFFEKELG